MNFPNLGHVLLTYVPHELLHGDKKSHTIRGPAIAEEIVPLGGNLEKLKVFLSESMSAKSCILNLHVRRSAIRGLTGHVPVQ